jgi:GntR family transcriptional regulator of vanillate catabolism
VAATKTPKPGRDRLPAKRAHAPAQALQPASAQDKPGSASAQAWAQMRLREMMLSGELPGGTRIAELTVVQKLGVSRTPIRAALMRLEQEGLLQALAHGGFAVKTFSERDIADAIELRGTLEGLLARLAAERGAPAVLLGEARACLDAIDQVLELPALSEQAFGSYVALNERLHQLLAEMAASPVLQQQLERVVKLPFASPSAFVIARARAPRARDKLVVAQDQHRQVLAAIASREGARAEAIMREHSRLAQRNLAEVLAEHGGRNASDTMPEIRLIRRRA